MSGVNRVSPRAHRPTDDRLREQTNYDAQIQPTLSGAQERDIGDPRVIWAISSEIACQMILYAHRVRAGELRFVSLFDRHTLKASIRINRATRLGNLQFREGLNTLLSP